MPLTDPGFACNLPAVMSDTGSLARGGFVTVPKGGFRLDEGSTLVLADQQIGIYRTQLQPALEGTRGLSYDAALSRWIPASSDMLSRDGSRYAWSEILLSSQAGQPTGRVHLTRVTDGRDQSWPITRPNDPDVRFPYPITLGIDPRGVLITFSWEGSYTVWRLDPGTGSLNKVSGREGAVGYGAGAVWLSLNRATGGSYMGADTLVRLDPSSGAAVEWFHTEDGWAGYAGVDGDGSLWVFTNGQYPALWRVTAPGQAQSILTGELFTHVISDGHGTWFGNESGVYLFAGGRVQRVSSAAVGEVAGPCVD